MSTVPPDWKPHEKEAYLAWERGDQERLVKACDRMIWSLARRFARQSRLGSDELRPRKQPNLRSEDLALREAGLREAREVADPDELYQVGCEEVLKLQGRYDPRKGTFQAFAYKRIWGAMKDRMGEVGDRSGEPQGAASDLHAGLDAAIRHVHAGNHDPTAFFDAFCLGLRTTSLEDWQDMMQGATFETVKFVWGFLHQNADSVCSEIGEDKHRKMLATANDRFWILVLTRRAHGKASPREISSPMHMEVLQRQHKDRNPLAPPIPKRRLKQVLGKDDKTIARYETTMQNLGAPPVMRRDGSFTIKTREDRNEWINYWTRVADPPFWRRLQRRSER